ncbi:hypothetical protein SPHINGOAX6_70095 [Sphingomonas sp. AX6]|nr:hypothetical protein SPHINGOAX6_70095 [Sphingomonas sp. AX6]
MAGMGAGRDLYRSDAWHWEKRIAAGGAGHVARRGDRYLYGDYHSQHAGRLAVALGWARVN